VTLNIAKLPKWAQKRIANLERDVERLTETIKREVLPTARITRQEFIGREHIEIPLLDDKDRVRFRLAIPHDPQQPHRRQPIIEVGFGRGMLHAMSLEYLDVRAVDGRLTVMPDSSNAILVGVESG
jgi:hypothetical protein